jgi:methionyl-tRNA formyltransferase
LPVYQPEKLDDSALALLENIKPDFLLVVAYGLLLPKKILNLASLGALNVHASLLPKYRGSAPIQRALIQGEQVTGISIIQMDKGLDTGPILLQRALAIGIEDTAGTLHDQLAELGAELLIQVLEKLPQNGIYPVKQDDALASYAPKLKKNEGNINWNNTAWQVHNLIRGVHPWPGAYFNWSRPKDGKTIKIKVSPGRIGSELHIQSNPGEILGLEKEELQIACLDRTYLISRLKPAGSKEQSAREFYCGYLKD